MRQSKHFYCENEINAFRSKFAKFIMQIKNETVHTKLGQNEQILSEKKHKMICYKQMQKRLIFSREPKHGITNQNYHNPPKNYYKLRGCKEFCHEEQK